MDKEMEDFQDALEKVDVPRAIAIADSYVAANPEKFSEFEAIVAKSESEREARENIVAAIDKLRGTLPIQHHLAEMFHLNRWHPPNIGGESEPTVRTLEINAKVQPKVREPAAKTAKK